jgi:hypothetical protein
MKRSFALLWALPVVVFMASEAAGYTYNYNRVFDRAFDASHLKRISISVENVRVEGWEVDSVEVHAEYHVESKGWYWGGSESYNVEFDESGRTLEIREIEEHHDIIIGVRITRRVRGQFVIRIPQHLALEVHGANGRIKLQNLAGPVRVTFENGRLEAQNLSGPDLRLDFKDGLAEISDFRGALEAQFRNGRLQLDEGSLSAVRLEYSNGKVESDAGICGGGPYRVDFDDGSFNWILPCSTAATFEARVDNGSIRTNLPGLGRKLEHRYFTHTLGSGGPLVRIEANDGNIVLETWTETKKQAE